MGTRRFIGLFCACLCLCGCFETIEEVTYTDSQSGTYLLTLNCSKSKSRLKALVKLDTFMGLNIPKQWEVSNYFNTASLAVEKVPGISQVNYTEDYTNFIFTFTFKFDKTETLNKAINAAAVSITNKSNLPYYNVFNSSEETFQRNKTPNDSMARLAKKSSQHLKLISGAKATAIYRFHKPVKKVSNSKAVISKNGKAVMLQQDLPKIITDPALFTNTITF